MKQLTSKKYPNRQPQVVSDDIYDKLISIGLASRFTVTEIQPVKVVIPPVIKVEVKKKVNKK